MPPVATKGSYYEPPFIRRQWNEARLALERATKVFIVGYRLPANDFATTTLIGQHLASDAEITLVNSRANEPKSVLDQIARPAWRVIEGPDCVRSGFMDLYRHMVGEELVPALVAKLGLIGDEVPVMASIADAHGSHAITRIEVGISRLALVANETPFQWADEQIAVHVAELRAALGDAQERQKLVVIRCGGVDHLMLALTVMEQPVRWAHVQG